MKPRSLASRLALPASILIGTLVAVSSASAASDTWNQTIAGTYDWNNGANWLSGTQFPDGSGQTANVNNNIAGAQTINLNVPITIGTLNLGDASGTSVFTIGAGTAGSLIFDNGASNSALASSGGSNVISSGVQLNSNLSVSNTTALSLNGAISGAGNLTKTGNGTLTLGSANTFAGTVTVSTGALTLNAASSLGGSGNTVNVTGTLNLNSGTTTNYGGGIITLNNGALMTLSNSGNTSDTTGKIVVAAGATASFNRINNTFNSNTNTVATNGLDFGAAGVGATLNHSIPSNGQNIRLLINGTTTFFGNSTINANQADAGDTIHYGRGIVQSGGNYSFTKGGTGVLVLGSATFASTYGGTTTVNAGTLRIGVADSLPDTALAVSSGATFDMSAAGTGITNATFNQRVLGLNDGTGGGGTITGNSINLANSGSIGSRTLTLDGTTGTFTFSGVIQDKPVANVTANSTLSLTKSGGSTQTLSGTNTYTGNTTVSGGTLIVNGSISTSSLTTVAVGATLSGTGTVGKAIVNGTFAPGASPGTMTFTDTLGLNGITQMEIDGTSGAGVTGGHDFVNLTGTGAAGVLTYGGTLTLDMGVIFAVGTYSWNLFDFASETGTFTTITLADQYSGSLLDDGVDDDIWNLTSGFNSWQFNESNGVLDLTVVPEPNVAALLAGLGVLGLLRRRRTA